MGSSISPTYREATINSIEAVATVSGSAGGGPQTYTFFAHKFTEPGTYKVEVRGKNTQSMTVTIKNPPEAPTEPKRAAQ